MDETDSISDLHVSSLQRERMKSVESSILLSTESWTVTFMHECLKLIRSASMSAKFSGIVLLLAGIGTTTYYLL
jgi:hypothetical protein